MHPPGKNHTGLKCPPVCDPPLVAACLLSHSTGLREVWGPVLGKPGYSLVCRGIVTANMCAWEPESQPVFWGQGRVVCVPQGTCGTQRTTYRVTCLHPPAPPQSTYTRLRPIQLNLRASFTRLESLPPRLSNLLLKCEVFTHVTNGILRKSLPRHLL